MKWILKTSLLGLVFLSACASTTSAPKESAKAEPVAEVKKEEPKKAEPPAKAPMILIPDDTSPLGEIDPVTLKVTYNKGADPKKIVDQVVKSWAATTQQLQQCQAAYQQLQQKK